MAGRMEDLKFQNMLIRLRICFLNCIMSKELMRTCLGQTPLQSAKGVYGWTATSLLMICSQALGKVREHTHKNVQNKAIHCNKARIPAEGKIISNLRREEQTHLFT